MHDFKKLNVWQEAMDLTVEIYKITSRFPSSEKFNLVSQMNRSAVSIVSNIAEGSGRKTKGEFGQFLGFASGSCKELETQLILSQRLDFIKQDEFDLLERQLHAIQKMLVSLSRSISP